MEPTGARRVALCPVTLTGSCRSIEDRTAHAVPANNNRIAGASRALKSACFVISSTSAGWRRWSNNYITTRYICRLRDDAVKKDTDRRISLPVDRRMCRSGRRRVPRYRPMRGWQCAWENDQIPITGSGYLEYPCAGSPAAALSFQALAAWTFVNKRAAHPAVHQQAR